MSLVSRSIFWRDGRVVECGGLENHCAATYRGFESLSLRWLKHQGLKTLMLFLYNNISQKLFRIEIKKILLHYKKGCYQQWQQPLISKIFQDQYPNFSQKHCGYFHLVELPFVFAFASFVLSNFVPFSEVEYIREQKTSCKKHRNAAYHYPSDLSKPNKEGSPACQPKETSGPDGFPNTELSYFFSYSSITFQLLIQLSIASIAILTATALRCSKYEFEFILNIEA